MSNPKLQALEDLKKFGATYRGLVLVAEELARIGSLEQANDEAVKQLAQTKQQQQQAKQEHDAFLKTAEQQRKDAEAGTSAALADAKKVVDRQKAEAANVLAKAKADAEAVLQDAKQRGDDMVAKAQDSLRLVNIQIEDAGAALAQHQHDAEQLRKQRDAHKSELASIRERVAKLVNISS
jgi:cell division septum initiation protein DivIVA